MTPQVMHNLAGFCLPDNHPSVFRPRANELAVGRKRALQLRLLGVNNARKVTDLASIERVQEHHRPVVCAQQHV
eukprot:CAMPEP_0184749526 /NCGR_PEP_ID=MMETSP0315-20130426/28728_1 /TAXON_ID=101924 /ORGANISM="Rhodosorus marinus, Strain UTEX LB 2760" /LENGTH=73 /DNA_ID=CAMNT_0027226601 /DNA_START=330 /DNA_END=548 /DNA_ORIENTATION=+